MAGRRRENVRHARRDHQPVAGMQQLEFAAHQLAAADLAIAGIGAAFLGAAIGDAALAIQHMDIIVPMVMGFRIGVDHPRNIFDEIVLVIDDDLGLRLAVGTVGQGLNLGGRLVKTAAAMMSRRAIGISPFVLRLVGGNFSGAAFK